MALIPPDAGIRLRMQTETNLLQPTAPARELPASLDELRPGQNFTARIQESLPDNTYRALVAGRQITLQLTEGAKANDVLDLVVVDRTARGILARQVTPHAAGGDAAAPYAFAKFSPAGRLIAQLLPPEGQQAPPARLNGGQPLLDRPPLSPQAAALLAPTLARAVSQSGVFYEAHQAQWVTGRLPLAQLLQEPQGQRSAPAAFLHASAESAGRSAVSANVSPQGLPQTGPEKLDASDTAIRGATPGPGAQPVPETLRPIVQQQLDAVALHRLAWHGEIWPGQGMDWEIEWESEREGDGSEEEALRWQTSLSLTTPRLGRVDARLRLTADGVHIVLATPYGSSAADLRDAAPELAAALEAAGVPLLGFQVRHEEMPEDA